MHSYRERLKDFFDINSSFIHKQYPGINLKRIISEFEDYFKQDEADFTRYLNGLKNGVPLAYISHKSFFYNSIFKINQDVLIPRFETEILVEMALTEIKKNKFKSICDVGVGPGTILFSILKDSPTSLVATGLDISSKALDLALENLKLLQTDFKNKHEVSIKESDRLEQCQEFFDLIISNPPYIKEADKSTVHPQVINFEPHIALFLKDSEFENWFETFFLQVANHLNGYGVFIMEGHEDHLPRLQQLAEKYFSTVQIVQDLTMRDRFLKAKK